MDSKEYLGNVVRDAMLIDSLHRALFAMRLTNGCKIVIGETVGTLHFDHEIERLQRSLRLLGIDALEQLPVPSGGRNIRNTG